MRDRARILIGEKMYIRVQGIAGHDQLFTLRHVQNRTVIHKTASLPAPLGQGKKQRFYQLEFFHVLISKARENDVPHHGRVRLSAPRLPAKHG